MFGMGSFIEKVVSAEDCSEVQYHFSKYFSKGRLLNYHYNLQLVQTTFNMKLLLQFVFKIRGYLQAPCPINIFDGGGLARLDLPQNPI